MAITKVVGRQNVLVATVKLTHDTLDNDVATAEAVMDLPAGSRVVGGDIVVTEVFNSTTSDVMDVGDSDDPDEYIAAVDLTALGRTICLLTGVEYPAGKTIDVEWTAGTTATATTGEATLQIWYTIEDRALETQPARA